MTEVPKPPEPEPKKKKEKKPGFIKAWFYKKFSRRQPDDKVLVNVPVLREELEDGKKEVKSSIIITEGKDVKLI